MSKQVLSKPIDDAAEAESALHYLHESAFLIGAARQRLLEASAKVKATEALMFMASDAKSAEAKKAFARASKEVAAASVDEAVAAGEFEKLRALREAASARLEAWRSASANLRAMRI